MRSFFLKDTAAWNRSKVLKKRFWSLSKIQDSRAKRVTQRGKIWLQKLSSSPQYLCEKRGRVLSSITPSGEEDIGRSLELGG